MSDDLLRLTDRHQLHLATPPGLETWKRNDTSETYSTLDLTFVSTSPCRTYAVAKAT